MKPKNKNRNGIVFSTDPSFNKEEEDPGIETSSPENQHLRIRLDTKHRAGKAVTLIEGFEGKESDLQDLGKKIKTFCGSGGSAKHNEIIIQGDHREKVLQYLLKNGYRRSKKV